jgi:adenine-specific DNA-methyltransferase
MNYSILKPRKALNKAFLKVKANRNEIELFKGNLAKLIDSINESESEEHHKKFVSDFLMNTYYGTTYSINTKRRADLVIYNGSKATDSVGVIIEAKSPTNRAEMMSCKNVNTKAFHELVLYYLRERITLKNLEVKHLVVTNIYEWFVFDAAFFEREFAQNKKLVKQFVDFEEGRLAGKTTDFFYKHIAEPAIEEVKHEVAFTHFDIRDYEKPLRNTDKKDDSSLIALFKLLSPEHLLKLPFANDSNSLDKSFYTELLHIIGLVEIKEGSKKLIQRKKEGDRNEGSLMESAIFQLDNLDKISRLEKPLQFGEAKSERLFNVALELTITWVNRILFLKLLEAQLIRYHKGDRSYAFLNTDKVKSFDDLNNLFFSVLARRPQERNDKVKVSFAKVPYLNSSLFEPTELEQTGLFISQLTDGMLPLLSSTVIKSASSQKRTGELLTIEYIFEFLNAYDFASEGREEIQEENKRLINASVLGLIFEKINGYKDGSFFTPGFITMYMCRETIRRAVLQKFKEVKGWDCDNLTQLFNIIGETKSKEEANTIINSLKICDPAVGSGHFLVSALNEMIAIKSELELLCDRHAKILYGYTVEVVNDELIVTDGNGDLFEYNPTNRESQRVQETLFHEKQTIIENCLFGVDLNPNSVKICRLRLWIELLKNAYYREPDYTELETLPNIDINIKCGNSLISRYPLDADLRKVLKGKKYSIDSYRLAVQTYKHASSKEEKHEMDQLILKIKQEFTYEIRRNDPLKTSVDKLAHELYNRFSGNFLFEPTQSYGTGSSKDEKKKKEVRQKLEKKIEAITLKMEEIKNSVVYQNAFEWRFEFPEVLNDDGDFVGFDVVIGNPPYGMITAGLDYFTKAYKTVEGRFDLFEAFVERGMLITKLDGITKYILPNTILTNLYSQKLRRYLFDNFYLIELTNFGMNVFEEATVHTCIIGIQNSNRRGLTRIRQKVLFKEELDVANSTEMELEKLVDKKTFAFNITLSFLEVNLFTKISIYKPLNELCYIRQCIKTGNDKEYVRKSTVDLKEPWEKSLRGKGIERYQIVEEDLYLKYCDALARNWKNKSFYETPKIAIRETGNRIIAAIDLDNRYFLSTLYGVYPKGKFNVGFLKYLLGVLNSKLATFFVKKIAFDLTEGAFTKVRTNQLGRFPIPLLPSIEELISSKVDQILQLKSNNIDTSYLETEIDQLVYQLYGLTEDEILIVEGGENE